MNIIINTSNLYVGGGVQVALSFINELNNVSEENNYHVFVSKAVRDQIDYRVFSDKFKFYFIPKSPSHLIKRLKITKFLSNLEEKIMPDVVFTVFGPSYWRPKARHVVGFALGWITNPASEAYKTLNFKQKIKRRLDTIYKSYYLKRDTDIYIVETEDVKEKLFKVFNISKEKTFVVGNIHSSFFNGKDYPAFKLLDKKKKEFRLVTIAHNYSHKNIKIIKEVLPYLKDREMNYKFFITIDDESYNSLFKNYKEQVINLGPVKSKYCPSLYKQCDALFLPTLLESFTASYPEAMKMKKPICTSDLSFAHSICHGAALYFDPLDSKDIADKIMQLAENKSLQKELISKGTERLKDFETAESRASKYLEVCKKAFLREI
jgi:glycosyltransferase involved in cell wall biosynthesis